MRILALTHVLPYPLDSGAKVRAYQVLRWLAQRHDVTLLSFSRPADLPEHIAHLAGFLSAVHTVPIARGARTEAASLARSVIFNAPHTLVRDAQAAMLRTSRGLAQTHAYDAIHADQLAMAAHALAAAAVSARHPRLVLDAHNAYFLIPQRLAGVARNPIARAYFRREARLLAQHERETYLRFDRVLTVSDQDRDLIRALTAGAGVAPVLTTLPVCVEVGARAMPRNPEARGILLLGGLHWPPNADGAEWFASRVFPRVSERVPGSRLFIVGARPPAAVRRFGDAAGAVTPKQSDQPVLVTGYVGDPRPFIEASAVLAVPLRSGGGMRVKIVEAMAWGLPVVSTRVGAEGLSAVSGEHILVADDELTFAEAIGRVMCEPVLAARLSAAGRRLAEAHYDWRTQYGALDDVYAR